MMLGCSVLLVLSFLVTLPASLRGEQCKPVSINPCIAQCNGTTFDLTYVFDFPLNVSGFIWSPCLGFNCTGESGLDCAVCQNIGENYNVNCGKKSNPLWVWYVNEKPEQKFPNWKIEYTFGTTWRISMFEFVIDESVKEPTVTFIGEDPVLQYNFHVIGNCLGQPTEDCQKHYDKIKQKREMRKHQRNIS